MKYRLKPFLLKKFPSGNRSLSEKRTIGLVGVNRGAGVTYTGVLLSSYFGIEKRIKTAYLECNNHQDFERLQNAFEWEKEDDKSFTLDRVTYYKKVPSSSIPEIMTEDYGCLIMDFGTDYISWKEEFIRCGTKIIIGDQAIWNQCKLMAFLSSIDNIGGIKNCLHIIPFAEKNVIARLSKKTGRDLISIPYEPDPMILSKETYKIFQNLFG